MREPRSEKNGLYDDLGGKVVADLVSCGHC